MDFTINDLSDYCSKINDLTYKFYEEKRIRFKKYKKLRFKYSEDHLNGKFNSIFFRFPYADSPLSENLEVHSDIIECFNLKCRLNLDESYELIQEDLSKIDEEDIPYEFDDIVRQKLQNVYFNYDKLLDAFKKEFFLPSDTNEKVIIINLLNKYREIRKRGTKQLNFLPLVSFPKEISDIILNFYIEFLERRLKFIEPSLMEEFKINSQSSQNSEILIKKVIWTGTQKELAELFIQLQKKNWIEEIDFRDFLKTTRSICKLFDITKTKKRHDSNEVNSLNQLLKGRQKNKIRKFFIDEDTSYCSYPKN